MSYQMEKYDIGLLERFTSEDHYEWLKDYSHFRHLIQQHIQPSSSDVLFVDSGDPWNPRPEVVSRAMEMVRGVHWVLKLHGIFISIVFDQPHFRRPLYNAHEFTWSIDYSHFRHLIQQHIQPSSSWRSMDPRPEVVSRAMEMVRGVHWVLKLHGIFISIVFDQPHFRRPLYNAHEFTWSIEYATFGDGFHYFFYILTKALYGGCAA